MRRWSVSALVIATAMCSVIAGQTPCDCTGRSVQPVVGPSPANIRYMGGLGTSAASAPVLMSSPVPAGVYPVAPGTTAYRPLVPIVQAPPSYYVGRGIIGQPTLYVPGQPLRNFLRYLSP